MRLIPNAVAISLMVLGLGALTQCKPSGEESSQLAGTDSSVPWENLQVGQKFRIALPEQSSACLMPGKDKLTTKNCGDQAYWIVRAHYGGNPYIKIVQHTVTKECLRFTPSGTLVTAPCIGKETDARSNRLSLSDYERQWLTADGGRLSNAARLECTKKVVGRYGASVKTCKTTFTQGLPTMFSEAVDFYGVAADRNPDLSAPLSEKLVYRSGLKMGDRESSTQVYVPEIRWGYIPRIRAIYVATESDLQYGMYAKGATKDAWITGVQVHYSNGSKELIGTCLRNRSGDCVVKRTDHPNYPNPIYFDQDEYVTAIGMKFARHENNIFTANPNLDKTGHGRDSRLVELMIKTNKTPQKMMLWRGAGNARVAWQWLSAPKGQMIAGVFGGYHILAAEGPSVIHSMGVFFAAIDLYKAHNPETMRSSIKVSPLTIKDSFKMIGTTDQNRNPRGCLGEGKMDYCFDQGGSDAYKRLFYETQFKFSSTFYASALGESKRLSSVRAYFKAGVLVAIVLHPEGVGGNVQPEIYGTIPSEAPYNTPKIYIELGPKEHITAVNFSDLVNVYGGYDPKPGHVNEGGDQELVGPRITGLQIVTNRNRVVAHSETDKGTAVAWKKGLGRPGYAITGFHGLTTNPTVEGALNFAGIVNLGAWLVKESELP